MDKSLKFIISQPSMTILTTPFLSYYKERLTEEIGAPNAEKVIQHAYHYLARMDEGDAGSADNVPPEERTAEQRYDYAVDHLIHPVLGIMEGMERIGYPEEYSSDLVVRIWNEAPESVKR